MAIQAQRFLSKRTRRIVLAFIIALSIYLLAVTPVRTYIDQRHEMQAAEQRYQLLADANKQLADRVNQLQTDAEIARLAREKYEYVTPGTKAYAVMDQPVQPAAPATEKEDEGFVDNVVDTLSFWN